MCIVHTSQNQVRLGTSARDALVYPSSQVFKSKP